MVKKFLIFLVLAAILLTGCQSEPVNITIDRENHTLSDGTYTYHYVEQETSLIHTITITYPDGGRYEWMQSDTESYSNGTYDSALYADGDRMVDVILGTVIIGEPEPEKEPVSVELILLTVGLLVMGIVEIGCTDQVWYGLHGWKYKDAEPSDMAIAVIRASGIFEIVIAVILVIVMIVGK